MPRAVIKVLILDVDLTELLDFAGEVASQQLVGKKGMLALCTLVDASGKRTFVGIDIRDSMAAFAALRQLMRERGTVAYVWVSEAWAVLGEDAEPDAVPPSEHPKRQEIVMAVACNGFDSLARSWAMRRDHEGSVVALEKLEEILGHGSGPLANLLGARA